MTLSSSFIEEIDRTLGMVARPYFRYDHRSNGKVGTGFFVWSPLSADNEHEANIELAGVATAMSNMGHVEGWLDYADQFERAMAYVRQTYPELVSMAELYCRITYCYSGLAGTLGGLRDAQLDKELEHVRGIVAGKSVITYKAFDVPLGIACGEANSKYDALRIEQTRDNNGDIDTEALINKFRELEKHFTFEINGASDRWVEIRLDPVPHGGRASLFEEMYEQLNLGMPEMLADLDQGIVDCWWD